jgi:ADP-heptose:LPS heptosyltransferase
MVTNDSGPGHFSAVTPLRTVVLFGPETPALYGSVGNSIAITANLACSPLSAQQTIVRPLVMTMFACKQLALLKF